MRLEFHGCLFDSETRELLREGKPVRLSPKAFALLSVLLDVRPKALSKGEIHDRLWPATHVSEATLTSLVAELRARLGDDARRPQLVRTVHGFGYAFCGAVVDASPAAAATSGRVACRLIFRDREVRLGEGENLLGRASEATAWIDSSRASRRHARIVVKAVGVIIEDLGSKNGTEVRGRKIKGPVPLADGDEIRIGTVSMTFRILGDEPTETGLGQ